MKTERAMPSTCFYFDAKCEGKRIQGFVPMCSGSVHGDVEACNCETLVAEVERLQRELRRERRRAQAAERALAADLPRRAAFERLRRKR